MRHQHVMGVVSRVVSHVGDDTCHHRRVVGCAPRRGIAPSTRVEARSVYVRPFAQRYRLKRQAWGKMWTRYVMAFACLERWHTWKRSLTLGSGRHMRNTTNVVLVCSFFVSACPADCAAGRRRRRICRAAGVQYRGNGLRGVGHGAWDGNAAANPSAAVSGGFRGARPASAGDVCPQPGPRLIFLRLTEQRSVKRISVITKVAEAIGEHTMRRKLTKTGRLIGGMIRLAVVTAAGGILLRPKPPRPPTTVTSVAELEAYLHALTAFGAPPGLSLVVVKDGRVVYQRGFGLADGP